MSFSYWLKSFKVPWLLTVASSHFTVRLDFGAVLHRPVTLTLRSPLASVTTPTWCLLALSVRSAVQARAPVKQSRSFASPCHTNTAITTRFSRNTDGHWQDDANVVLTCAQCSQCCRLARRLALVPFWNSRIASRTRSAELFSFWLLFVWVHIPYFHRAKNLLDSIHSSNKQSSLLLDLLAGHHWSSRTLLVYTRSILPSTFFQYLVNIFDFVND